MKQICVLGSTGSIGTQTLDVIRAIGRDPGFEMEVTALAAGGARPRLFAQQIAEFRPRLAVVYDTAKAEEVKELARSLSADHPLTTEFVSGMEGLDQAASAPFVDTVVTSLVGMIGIEPTVSAIRSGKTIALANKETLVCAGALIKELADQRKVRILPVDSEHGAVFQCLQGVDHENLKKIWLTASGGPFRGFSREQLEEVTLSQALHHPTWSMGAKITIDSATLMNKGLEMIEAKWLFDVDIDQVQPIIHPQSLVHSMIELRDGSVLAQLGPTDMRLPIEVALTYPKRGKAVVEPLDFRKVSAMTFEEIDEKVFPATAMAREAMKEGGLCPAVFNAANEIAVDRFRKGQIGFCDIYRLADKALSAGIGKGYANRNYSLEEVLQIRQQVENWL